MTRAEEFRRQAEAAEQAGKAARSPLERDSYDRIARGWRELEASARLAERRGR